MRVMKVCNVFHVSLQMGRWVVSISPPLLIIDELLLEVQCILHHEVEGSCKKSLEGLPCQVVR